MGYSNDLNVMHLCILRFSCIDGFLKGKYIGHTILFLMGIYIVDLSNISHQDIRICIAVMV